MRSEFPDLRNGICVIKYRGQYAIATDAKDCMQRLWMAPGERGKWSSPILSPSSAPLRPHWAHLAQQQALILCPSADGRHFAILSNTTWHSQRCYFCFWTVIWASKHCLVCHHWPGKLSELRKREKNAPGLPARNEGGVESGQEACWLRNTFSMDACWDHEHQSRPGKRRCMKQIREQMPCSRELGSSPSPALPLLIWELKPHGWQAVVSSLPPFPYPHPQAMTSVLKIPSCSTWYNR